MFNDVIHTPKEWFKIHNGHKRKQFFHDRLNGCDLKVVCVDCQSVKHIDTVIYNHNDITSSNNKGDLNAY